MTMTSNRPYLVRAFYEWIVDNNCTPHLVVDATVDGTMLPVEHIQDGQIVLNISPSATGNLLMSDEQISFNARFSGRPQQLLIPYQAVLAIYARENGAGTAFQAEPEVAPELEEQAPAEESSVDESPPIKPPKKGSHLKVVK